MGMKIKREIYEKTVVDCVSDTDLDGNPLMRGHVTDDYGIGGYCRFRKRHCRGDIVSVVRDGYKGYKEIKPCL